VWVNQAKASGRLQILTRQCFQERGLANSRLADCIYMRKPVSLSDPEPAECIWKGEEEFKCMKLIETDEVYNACKELISEMK
jgi:hypothetical protein